MNAFFYLFNSIFSLFYILYSFIAPFCLLKYFICSTNQIFFRSSEIKHVFKKFDKLT